MATSPLPSRGSPTRGQKLGEKGDNWENKESFARRANILSITLALSLNPFPPQAAAPIGNGGGGAQSGVGGTGQRGGTVNSVSVGGAGRCGRTCGRPTTKVLR